MSGQGYSLKDISSLRTAKLILITDIAMMELFKGPLLVRLMLKYSNPKDITDVYSSSGPSHHISPTDVKRVFGRSRAESRFGGTCG